MASMYQPLTYKAGTFSVPLASISVQWSWPRNLTLQFLAPDWSTQSPRSGPRCCLHQLYYAIKTLSFDGIIDFFSYAIKTQRKGAFGALSCVFMA